MQGHFYKPHCKCVDSKGESKKTKKCSCGANWAYILDVGIDAQTGIRKQKKKGGYLTKGDAVKAAALIIAELENGTYSTDTNATFEDISAQWLKDYAAKAKKPGTVRIRTHELNNLLPFFAKLKAKDISGKMYQDAILSLKEKFADSTMEGIHSTGRMIFKFAIREKVIKNDPTQYAYLPKTKKSIEELEEENSKLPKFLEKEELALFLRIAKDRGLERDFEIFRTLAYTGVRVGELCALRETDIDHVEQTISITKTYYNPDNNIKEYQLVTPKTKNSERKISVDPEVLADLDRLRIRQSKVRLRLGDRYHNKKFVFSKMEDFHGYPEYIKFIENRMKRLLKLAGLNEALTPHSLRHTHCSLLAEAGASLEQIMERLGHGDDEITKRVYLHVTKPQKKEASHKFSELMKNLL